MSMHESMYLCMCISCMHVVPILHSIKQVSIMATIFLFMTCALELKQTEVTKD